MSYFDVHVNPGSITFMQAGAVPGLSSNHVNVRFIRTLRLPDDGKTYPLPPGIGTFPVKRVDDYKDRVPPSWVEHGGVFLPMYQREALWLSFFATTPAALKVAAGKINAVSGEPWSEALVAPRDQQDYMVVPNQPWLDGFNSGEGKIRQFVAMPLGMGYTVEGQLTGKEDVGGLQILCVAAKEGKFKEGMTFSSLGGQHVCSTKGMQTRSLRSSGSEMGLAAGGWMTQKIYADPYGIDTWDLARTGRCFVHIVNSVMWQEVTGEAAPESPISVQHYTRHGLPWFALYDENVPAVAVSGPLSTLASVAAKDQAHGFKDQQDNTSVEVKPGQVKTIPGPVAPNAVRDGKW